MCRSAVCFGRWTRKKKRRYGKVITASCYCLREETSLRAISRDSTQKNRNNCVLPSTYFSRVGSFDGAAVRRCRAGLKGQAAGRGGRPQGGEGRAGLTKERPPCPPSGTALSSRSSPAPFPLPNTYRVLLMRLWAFPHGHRARRSLWDLEPPPAARDPQPRCPLPSPAGHRPLQDTAPQPRAAPAGPSSPCRAQGRRSSPRTHGPAGPGSAQRSLSSRRRCRPGPSPSGPPWACRDLEFGAGPAFPRSG